jgi:hypothetical protein
MPEVAREETRTRATAGVFLCKLTSNLSVGTGTKIFVEPGTGTVTGTVLYPGKGVCTTL